MWNISSEIYFIKGAGDIFYKRKDDSLMLKIDESATSLVFSEDETDGLDHSQSAVFRFGINEVITKLRKCIKSVNKSS